MTDTTNTMRPNFKVNKDEYVYQDSTISAIFDRESNECVTIKMLDVLRHKETHEKIYYDFEHHQDIDTNLYLVEEL